MIVATRKKKPRPRTPRVRVWAWTIGPGGSIGRRLLLREWKGDEPVTAPALYEDEEIACLTGDVADPLHVQEACWKAYADMARARPDKPVDADTAADTAGTLLLMLHAGYGNLRDRELAARAIAAVNAAQAELAAGRVDEACDAATYLAALLIRKLPLDVPHFDGAPGDEQLQRRLEEVEALVTDGEH